MTKNFKVFFLFFSLWSIITNSQTALAKKDSITNEKNKTDKITFLIYERIISNSKGALRTDQNFIGNFRLLKWLKLDAGMRFGERPTVFNSYYHYKLELQTKFFWKTLRAVGRISDNVINYPIPSYRKTNELFAIEGRHQIAKAFRISGGLGYVFSSQENIPDALPTNMGVQNNYPIYKVSLSYIINNRGFFELTYGSYDVFNPYELNSPFMQLTEDFELTHSSSLYSYFRYQYDNSVFTPNNYFFAVGLMFHLF